MGRRKVPKKIRKKTFGYYIYEWIDETLNIVSDNKSQYVNDLLEKHLKQVMSKNVE